MSALPVHPELEARNIQLVLRRIAVLNSRDHEAAVQLVDECYASNFVANVKCVWYKSSGREGMVRAFDEAFAAGSTILEPKFSESVTAERVEYSYSGRYNGAAFTGFLQRQLHTRWKVFERKLACRPMMVLPVMLTHAGRPASTRCHQLTKQHALGGYLKIDCIEYTEGVARR
jgi:hypothetical protein